jgi:hypothetical protein
LAIFGEKMPKIAITMAPDHGRFWSGRACNVTILKKVDPTAM